MLGGGDVAMKISRDIEGNETVQNETLLGEMLPGGILQGEVLHHGAVMGGNQWQRHCMGR